MIEKTHCDICEKKFRFYFRPKYKCSECGNLVCKSHSRNPLYLHDRCICSNCDSLIRNENDKIIIVKSNHIGQHNITQTLDEITSDFMSKFGEEAIENIKYKAYKAGGNGIINLKPLREVIAKGNYITTITGYKGRVVKVEKK